MKKIVFLFAQLLFSYAVFAQNANDKVAIKYIQPLLDTGIHKFEALVKDVPTDLAEIIEIYQNNISQRIEWFREYSAKYKNKKPPHHKNFGISKAEYDRMNTEFPKLPMKVKGTPDLRIAQYGDTLKFKGEGTFTMFDGMIIDTKNNKLVINDLPIPLKGETKDVEGIGKVNAYTWKYEYGNASKALSEYGDYSMLELTIGTKVEDSTTTIVFTNNYIETGKYLINATISGYLK